MSFHPFMLVPTGRGKELAEQELDPDEYERALKWIYDAQQDERRCSSSPPTCRTTGASCASAPRPQGRKLEVHPHSHGGMNTLSRGCLAGVGFCFISHVGGVQPLRLLRQAGRRRARAAASARSGATSPLFAELRDFDALKGKCGACEYKRVCGGCRARAYEAHRRLHGRGALLRLRAQGSGLLGMRVRGALTRVTCATSLQVSHDVLLERHARLDEPRLRVQLLGRSLSVSTLTEISAQPALLEKAHRGLQQRRPMPLPRLPSVTTSSR